MTNKKYIKIFIIILIIIAVLFGIYNILSNYLFEKTDKGLVVSNGKKDLIEHIKNVEDDESRKNQIEWALFENLITQKDANELY